MEQPVMPVRRLHNHVYCPRLFYLQWVENLFQENEDTARGDHAHRAVDWPDRWKEELFPAGTTWHSLELESSRLGLRGVVDLVEPGEGGLCVVDYKAGHPRQDAEGRWQAKEADAIQVAAYAMLLEEAGHEVGRGRIYYAAARRHVEVILNEPLRQACLDHLARARTTAEAGQCPPPLSQDPRCLYCSAYPICLPGESAFWAGGTVTEDLAKHPPRPEGYEGETLVVQNARASLHLRGGELVVQLEGERVAHRPIEQVRAIYLYGAIQVSAQTLVALMEREVSVAYFSPAGRFLGMAHGLPASGVDARRGQYRLFEQGSIRTDLVREVVRAKIHNQRVMLMRNGQMPTQVIEEMGALRDRTTEAPDMDVIRGLEGAAAALYFQHFDSMLKGELSGRFEWKGRNRRPPRDPLNALLSLGYSVLTKELAGICFAVGLDPYLGFFHQPRYGRPALALDLMEEFRPLVADSVALSLINRQELDEDDFMHTTRGVFLKDEGRKAFWRAWARRMESEVTHPQFGYRMSYRRMMDVQARQLWRFCRGETQAYHGFTTR